MEFNVMIAIVNKRLKELEERVAKGKGTWHKGGYVKDDDWMFLLGEEFALRSLKDYYEDKISLG